MKTPQQIAFVYDSLSRTLSEYREAQPDATTGRPPLNSMYFVWTETESEKVWRLLKEGAVQNRNVWNDPQLTKKDKL